VFINVDRRNMQKQQGGTIEWVQNGRVVRKSFEAIVVQYPSGVFTAPHKFTGRLLLADDTTERPLLVLTAGSQLSSRGEVRRQWWLNPGYLFNQKVGLFAWALLLGAAVYKNLSHIFGF
jgi:hypothetical protein